MSTTRITDLFGTNLAEMLAEKIVPHHPSFDSPRFVAEVGAETADRTYTERVRIIAEALSRHLPPSYLDATQLLAEILGPENPSETGMFREFYWLLPVGKFVEMYGLDYFERSLSMTEEITKRNTGEYAIRPYIRRYPDKTLRRMADWARSDSFHLRRLASEGLRPKLPWATKLDMFVERPEPVFEILELLREDPIRFVQRSVANHLTDYLKVNPEPTRQMIERWKTSDHPSTVWIVRHATRKLG
jgi:3-methyladenine DNA glycosylase AlkC